jgi:hypothetical protein
VWEHPIDFDRFDMSLGVEYTYRFTLEEYPDALSDYIPDFETLGYVLGDNFLSLKDGEPVSFEGHYTPDEGTEILWCVYKEPDYYDKQASLGDISGLTEQLVTDTLSKDGRFSFTTDDCLILVIAKEAQAHDAWLAVESLK